MFCSTGGRGISVIRAFLGMAASLQALFSTCLSVCVCVCVYVCVPKPQSGYGDTSCSVDHPTSAFEYFNSCLCICLFR